MSAATPVSVAMADVPFTVRKTCRLCGRAKLTAVFNLPATPLANEFVKAPVKQEPIPLVVMLCENCGHAQLQHVVDSQRLFSTYAYTSGTSAVFREHFARYAEEVIERRGLKAGDFVLEIGSNDGTLLLEFQRRGMRVLGIEPAENLVDLAMKMGVPTTNAFFTSDVVPRVLREYGAPGVILANNVLAHIDELIPTLRSVRELLPDDGALIFEVQYVGDLLTHGLFDNCYHEHVSYHALAPLVTYFQSTVLNIDHVTRVPTHGGSLRITATMRSAAANGTVQRLLEEERDLGINTIPPWNRLRRSVEISRVRLSDSLSKAFTSNPDATVVGFGAPAKATTLMYALGLRRTDLDYIVDDSPLKQGLFTPGLHIPVYPPDHLLEDPPGHVVVLAWNFAKSIIEKWKPLLPNATFIVPHE